MTSYVTLIRPITWLETKHGPHMTWFNQSHRWKQNMEYAWLWFKQLHRIKAYKFDSTNHMRVNKNQDMRFASSKHLRQQNTQDFTQPITLQYTKHETHVTDFNYSQGRKDTTSHQWKQTQNNSSLDSTNHINRNRTWYTPNNSTNRVNEKTNMQQT